MPTTEFTDVFPGTHITSWTDDEGFDMVTVGIPGVEVSTLHVTDYDHVLAVWDACNGHDAPREHDPLYVALSTYMDLVADEFDTYSEAYRWARIYREQRSTLDARAGVNYRVVPGRLNPSRFSVERFRNW